MEVVPEQLEVRGVGAGLACEHVRRIAGGEADQQERRDDDRGEEKCSGNEPPDEESGELSPYASTPSSTKPARRMRTAPSHRLDRSHGSRFARSTGRSRLRGV